MPSLTRTAAVRPGTTRRNSFDLLRLAAALAVLVSHSFALAGDREPHVGSLALGTIAVLVFFAISGFLITQSWILEPRLLTFLGKRALRIMPALVAVLVLCALVLGLVATTLPPTDYLTDAGVWKYVGANALMKTTYELPGVFTSNPFPGAVNGSLWTLKHEVRCYLLVAMVGLAGLLRDRRAATAALLAAIGVAAGADGHGPDVLGDPVLLRSFCVAALLYVWRERVPWSVPAAVALLGAWVATSGSEAGVWVATLALPYATILAAYALPASWQRLTSRGDISYGVYLWAFPVQQVVASAWHDVPPGMLIALTLPATVALAIASWVLIERPAMRLKTRLVGRRRGPGATPAPAAATAPPSTASA
ncbi:MAG TPA: acyltransferase [Baekduia sp.]|uniref:acyltransferase family protein n=1 Tax=Baekduia sp. TaxID=2600305 RepID=UPI002B9ABAFE|nr:acyltransferase [Baekduia sp.]HMJ33995.1 acyltransferase [Baekduia sp.]